MPRKVGDRWVGRNLIYSFGDTWSKRVRKGEWIVTTIYRRLREDTVWAPMIIGYEIVEEIWEYPGMFPVRVPIGKRVYYDRP
jgi:hypothetical protein